MHIGSCAGLKEIYTQLRSIDGEENWDDVKLNMHGERSTPNMFGERSTKAIVPPGVSLVHFIVWKYILIELTKTGMGNTTFSTSRVLSAAAKRLKRRLGAADIEHRKRCMYAIARGEEPTFEKLTKWLHGIGKLVDGRIVISEKVLEFVNKDYG